MPPDIMMHTPMLTEIGVYSNRDRYFCARAFTPPDFPPLSASLRGMLCDMTPSALKHIDEIKWMPITWCDTEYISWHLLITKQCSIQKHFPNVCEWNTIVFQTNYLSHDNGNICMINSLDHDILPNKGISIHCVVSVWIDDIYPFYWHVSTFIPAWESNYIMIINDGIKSIIRFQTSTLKSANGWIISPHTLMEMRLLAFAQIKINPYK